MKYQNIKDENELQNQINRLEKIANTYLLEINELYMEDFFFMSVIDKSIKLIDCFLFALNKRNITVLATLTRVQMDCAMRAFATTLVNDSGDFCKAILINNQRIDRLKDINNKALTDKYLCEKLGSYLDLPIYDLYEKVCGYVHFSSSSFHNIARAHEKYDITMFISRNNREEDEKEFEKMSIELANNFLFFGSVLIEDIFVSWIEQKRRWSSEKNKFI